MGSSLMMFVMVLCGLVVGVVLKASANESAFVAACLSLSSTPLVVKFLTHSHRDHPTAESKSWPLHS